MSRKSEQYDVVVVGGGPSGMSAAIRLKQLAQKDGKDVRVCLVEKASKVSAHTVAGGVIETKALDELFPNWKEMGAPVFQQVKKERVALLTKNWRIPIPTFPGMPLYNRGNYIIRLGNVVKWLGEQAEAAGVEIRAGTAASEILYNEDGSVKGIATNDVGIAKDGSPKILEKYKLVNHPLTFGVGFKELWQLDPARHKPGYVEHTMGWPLPLNEYGGSFIYHIVDEGLPLAQVGFVVGLDYKNPYLNPFQEFQKWKTHPSIRKQLEGGKRLGYGAHAHNEGGFQSVPKVAFPGGCLVGCSASLLHVAKLKGVHTAMKSGMLAAESIYSEINEKASCITPTSYTKALENSYVLKEMKTSRNMRPSFNTGLGWLGGLLYTGIFIVLGRGKEPWTLQFGKKDHERLKKKEECKPIEYPKPDNKITFDLLSSVSLTKTAHDENQPSHVTLKNHEVPEKINLKLYDGPEQRFCPAGVYEYVPQENNPSEMRLQINAAKCIHCQVCDIKDPTQNIHWVTPEGGQGPRYSGM